MNSYRMSDMLGDGDGDSITMSDLGRVNPAIQEDDDDDDDDHRDSHRDSHHQNHNDYNHNDDDDDNDNHHHQDNHHNDNRESYKSDTYEKSKQESKTKRDSVVEDDYLSAPNTLRTVVTNGTLDRKPRRSILRNSKATDDVIVSPREYESRKANKETLYFLKSPNKRIDYVIAYEEKSVDNHLRLQYEKNLVHAGLELETEDKNAASDDTNYYVKVHCTWEVLMKGAEMLNMKKRLGILKDATRQLSQKNYGCCAVCRPTKVVNEEDEEFFTATFDSSRLELYEIGDKETFFNEAERSLIAKLILDWTKYDDTSKDGEPVKRMGVGGLIKKGIYKAAYPLHEVLTTEIPKDDPHFLEGKDKEREVLYHTWARFKNIFKYQPLEQIRDYFGEKVGLYFAWIGIYTTMLIPASIAGLAVFLYGIITMSGDPVVTDICSSGGNNPGEFIICPLCAKVCPYKTLKSSCQYARITHVFDNYATVAMAVFMAAWALIFLEIWKRREKELQYDWDMMDYEIEENMRPAYQIHVKGRKRNPITNSVRKHSTPKIWHMQKSTSKLAECEYEPHVKGYNRCCRLFTSFTCVLFLVALVCGSVFGVIVYRVIVVSLFYDATANVSSVVRNNSKLIITVTSSIISLIIITILKVIYDFIAKLLTNMELHRTQTEYEDAYTFKMIVFQFVNYYGTIFYIAYFKGSFVSSPGSDSMLLFNKYKLDQCDPTGCFVELTIQLAIIMIGKQILSNLSEYIIPSLMNCCRSCDNRKKKEVYMRWEQDLDLATADELGMFYEYLEIVIQFGFVTLFVAAFPLAPLFALINNMFEIRLDATKIVKLYRRTPAYRGQDIGAWFKILKYLAYIAVITNAFIIAWTSDFIPKMVYIFTQDDSSLNNFVNQTLTVISSSKLGDFHPDSNIDKMSPNITQCRYRDYTYSTSGSQMLLGSTLESWVILAARLAFVIIFEHTCFLLIFVVGQIIPGVPARVKRLSRYERQLNKALAYQSKFSTDSKSLINHILSHTDDDEFLDMQQS